MTYGVQDIVDRFAVGEHTVLGWIRRGELRAIDVSRNGSTRPKWRITEEGLAAFEALRASKPPQPKSRRAKSNNTDVIEFYKK